MKAQSTIVRVIACLCFLLTMFSDNQQGVDQSLKFWGKWLTYSRKRTVEDAVL